MMKQATTLEQQIAKLRSRKVEIADEEKAKEVLLDIGYYRLGFYFFPFEKSYPNLRNRDHMMQMARDLKMQLPYIILILMFGIC